MTLPDISIPDELLPRDGRFGSGPSRIRPDAIEMLMGSASHFLGTSHRQASVRFKVSEVRNGLAELFSLPDGYEVLLGNGGTTCFWDAATFGLIDRRSQHLSFGEFSSKFAAAAASAPFLDEPEVITAEPGDHPLPRASEGIDAYCLTHNETSTGVAMPLARPDGADPDALVLVDATSAAGGLRFDPSEVDVYYFAPQKCLASDGGLWMAACSPRAIERIERIAAQRSLGPDLLRSRGRARELPPRPDVQHTGPRDPVPGQRADPTGSSRTEASSSPPVDATPRRRRSTAGPMRIVRPRRSSPTRPSAPMSCRPSTSTAPSMPRSCAAVLRDNGILDVEPYRKLGRNQMRVALFPAIDPSDVEALTHCVDHILERLT